MLLYHGSSSLILFLIGCHRGFISLAITNHKTNMKNLFKTIIALFIILTMSTTNAQVKKDSINYELGSKNYPGVQPGEVFFTVIPENFYYDKSINDFIMTFPDEKNFTLKKNFDKISWKTKRLGYGLVAYGPYGNVLTGFRPVFVKESELKEAGLLE